MARHSHRQLTLPFPGHPVPESAGRGAPRTRAARTPVDRRTASASATSKTARTRAMPGRDACGRFVSFPTTDAPSWYVFCADGYRIPGESLPETIAAVVPAERRALPRAVARVRRTPRVRVTRVQLLMYLACIVGYIALLWYGLHLPRPHR